MNGLVEKQTGGGIWRETKSESLWEEGKETQSSCQDPFVLRETSLLVSNWTSAVSDRLATAAVVLGATEQPVKGHLSQQDCSKAEGLMWDSQWKTSAGQLYDDVIVGMYRVYQPHEGEGVLSRGLKVDEEAFLSTVTQMERKF